MCCIYLVCVVLVTENAMCRSKMLKCPTLVEGMGVIVSLYGLGKSSPHELAF